MLSKLLTTSVLVFSLVALMSDTASDAQQIRINERDLTPGALPEGLERDGVVWSFKTSRSGSSAPVVLGILSSAHPEPTDPSQHGAWWIKCTGPAEEFVCALKINAFGTILELANANWSLN